MKISFDNVALVNILAGRGDDGKFPSLRKVTSQNKDEGALTLRYACVEALLFVPDPSRVPGEEQVKRFQMALKIQDAKGEVELEAEDITLLKKLCATRFGPTITGQVRMLLEGKSIT